MPNLFSLAISNKYTHNPQTEMKLTGFQKTKIITVTLCWESYSWMKSLLFPVQFDTFLEKMNLLLDMSCNWTILLPIVIQNYRKHSAKPCARYCDVKSWTYNDFRFGSHWFSVIYPTTLSLYSYHLLTVGHWTSTGFLRNPQQEGWVSNTETYFILI